MCACGVFLGARTSRCCACAHCEWSQVTRVMQYGGAHGGVCALLAEVSDAWSSLLGIGIGYSVVAAGSGRCLVNIRVAQAAAPLMFFLFNRPSSGCRALPVPRLQ